MAMLCVFRHKGAAGLLTALLAMPIVAPLACEVPAEAAIDQLDGDRMTGFEVARVRALGEAMLSESAGDRAIVAALYASGESPIDTIPDGDYQCRTIKLGGLLPLTVYGYFDCAISGGGTVIEKLTGSQRFKGDLAPADGGLFYWGALHYGDEAPFAYGADPERNQVGCLYRIEGKPVRYRLEMPFPLFESTHDVIELIPSR
jgi:hypothetical protein